MYAHVKETLKRIVEILRERLHDRLIAVYAFGSRVRGDHEEWSDFDVLVEVKDRNPAVKDKIMEIFVEEELKT